jgi:hypothetical protein
MVSTLALPARLEPTQAFAVLCSVDFNPLFKMQGLLNIENGIINTDNDYGRILKEAIVIYFGTLFRSSPQETKKSNTVVRIADNLPKIRARFFLNKSFSATVDFTCFSPLRKPLCVMKLRETATTAIISQQHRAFKYNFTFSCRY